MEWGEWRKMPPADCADAGKLAARVILWCGGCVDASAAGFVLCGVAEQTRGITASGEREAERPLAVTRQRPGSCCVASRSRPVASRPAANAARAAVSRDASAAGFDIVEKTRGLTASG